jgi:hypothetical protein
MDARANYGIGLVVMLWPAIPCIYLTIENPYPETNWMAYWLMFLLPWVVGYAMYSKMKQVAIRRTPSCTKGDLDKTTMANTNVHGTVPIGRRAGEPISDSNPEDFMLSPMEIRLPGGISEFGVGPTLEDVATMTPQGTFINWRHQYIMNAHMTRYPFWKMPRHWRAAMKDAFPGIKDHHFVDVGTQPIFVIMNPPTATTVINTMNDIWEMKNKIKQDTLKEFREYHKRLNLILGGRENAMKEIMDGWGGTFESIMDTTTIQLDMVGDSMIEIRELVRNVKKSTPYFDAHPDIQDQEEQVTHWKNEYKNIWMERQAEEKKKEGWFGDKEPEEA